MSSIKERMKSLARIKVEFDQQFVVEIKKNNVTIGEIMCFVDELHCDMSKNESKVKLSVYNPHFKGKLFLKFFRLCNDYVSRKVFCRKNSSFERIFIVLF